MGFGECELMVERFEHAFLMGFGFANVDKWIYFPVLDGGSFHGHFVEILVLVLSRKS